MTLKELNLTRRSVHFFDRDKEVDMRLVKRVITEAAFAPSAYNLQPWRIIMLKTDEAKEKLYNLAFKQPKLLDASITLILVGDKEGYEGHNPVWDIVREKNGAEKTLKIMDDARKLYGKNESTKLKFEESNTGLFAMNLMLLFKAYGIDTHPLSGMNFEKVKTEFKLLDSEEVVMLIAVGHFDKTKKLNTRAWRKSYTDLVTEL